MDHSEERWRQGTRSWCMTLSVFAADSDSLCALFLSLSLCSFAFPLFSHSLALTIISRNTRAFVWNWTVQDSRRSGCWSMISIHVLFLMLIVANRLLTSFHFGCDIMRPSFLPLSEILFNSNYSPCRHIYIIFAITSILNYINKKHGTRPDSLCL